MYHTASQMLSSLASKESATCCVDSCNNVVATLRDKSVVITDWGYISLLQADDLARDIFTAIQSSKTSWSTGKITCRFATAEHAEALFADLKSFFRTW